MPDNRLIEASRLLKQKAEEQETARRSAEAQAADLEKIESARSDWERDYRKRHPKP